MYQSAVKVFTSGYPQHPHGTDNRRVDGNKTGLDFFENNSNNWQYDDCDIQTIPTAENTYRL